MKKQLLLFVCCLALVVSGMTHPESKKNSSKFSKKNPLENLYFKNHFDKEHTFFSQKHTFPFQKQHQTKSPKGDEWYEPDTIYGYYMNYADERRIFFV